MGIPPHSGRALELSAADAYQYERLAHSLLDEALFEYDHFVSVDRRRVNAARWRHWRQDDDITVYRERTASSDSNDDADVEPSPRAVASHHKSTTPRILAVGSLANTLDDVLYGVVTPSAATMRLRAAYTTTDDYVDGAVLAPIRTPTPHDPFQFVGLKWLLQRGNGLGLVRPQDFVFLEATGVQVRQDGSGQRVGFHIMHSVELPASVNPLLVPNSNARVQRGAFSTCYLYHELANGAVDVYMTAVVQPRGHVLASMAGRAAAAMLVNNWRALTLFAENKKLAWLLETHRQLQETTPTDPVVAHHNVSRCALCAKSFKGFTNRTKKRTSCQLCSLTVCGHCTVTRTLRHEGVARGSVVSTEMQFCKKCVATAGEESASEIARQQLWESEIVRTGRQHTQTALAIARRETVRARPTAYTYNPATGLSNERDLAEDAFLAMQDTMGGQQKPAKMSVSSDRRRTLNGTWNSSARATESLSIGTLNCRTSWFQDPTSQASQNAPADADASGDAGRESTTSSALVVMDDRANVTRRMKALDYLPSSRPSQQGADDTASAIIARSSIASSSVFTESQDFEVESVYSATSSIAVLDLAASSRGLESSSARRPQQPLTIAEEDQEPVSELEAFYLEQQRQQQVQQQQLLQRQRQQIQQQQRQSHLIQQQYQQPQPPQRRQPHARRSTMILLDPTQQQNQPRASRVRFSSAQDPTSDVRDSELLPGRPSLSPSVTPSVMTSSASVDEQRLSYQMQLWMQMHELRDTAESAYQITQRNSEAIAEQHPELLNNMRELVAQKAQARRQQRKQMMNATTPSKPSLSSMGGSSFTFSSQQPTPVKLSHRASTAVRY